MAVIAAQDWMRIAGGPPAEASINTTPAPRPAAREPTPETESSTQREPAATPRTCPPVIVPFAVGSATVTRAHDTQFQRLATWLQERPAVTVLIDGHADAIGDEVQNLALSRQRASVVSQRLGQLGVTRGRISVRGFGAFAPVEGETADSSANRRVVVHVRGTTECPPTEGENVAP